jgi:mannose PTS system EIID component
MSTLRRRDVAAVFFRSLFLQAGFNTDSMQSLGLVYALAPALARFYPDALERQVAVRRYLSTFNTHPYVAAAIVGGILFHESEAEAGRGSSARAEAFKQTLAGPLGALGGGFFWRSWLPLVGAAACVAVPVVGPWAALFFVVAYNVLHFATRAVLFGLAYRRGDGVLVALKQMNVPVWSARFRTGAAVFAGAAGAWLAFRLGAHVGLRGSWVFGLASFGVGALAAALAHRGVSRYVAFYLAGLIAVVFGALAP